MNNKVLKDLKSKETDSIQKIDLFWKARDFKPVEKSVDWYWIFWILTFSLIFILIYFYKDYVFSILIFLIAVVGTIGHRRTPHIIEYRINNDGISIDDGKTEISFDDIKSYNIDNEEGYIFINTNNQYQRLITIPFEGNHNISVIEKILDSKIEKDENLDIPFLEKLFERSLGF